MRNLASYLLILLLVVAAIFAQYKSQAQTNIQDDTPEWSFISESILVRFYISKKRVSKSRQGTILAWMKQIPRTDTKEGIENKQEAFNILTTVVGRKKAETYAYDLMLYELDCSEGKLRLKTNVVYDNSGIVLFEPTKVADESKWSYPPPESLSESILENGCKAASKLGLTK